MKISYNWLKQYINTDINHKEAAEILTNIGLEVEAIETFQSDKIFEIGLTPNRADATSHIGVARDLAAYLKHHQTKDVSINMPSVDNFKIDNRNNIISVVVENTDACKRYSGIAVSNVIIKESPEWLKTRLKSIDINSINNVVDITNFVLYETGQPLHAFDAAQVSGNKIIVKTVPESSNFVTLDEVERKLSSQDLMICNAERPMCIAGVFGGIDSGVTENTKNVFLESACFNPVFIRRTSKRHTLITDSSFRFERGTDPNNTIYALKRAALLIKEIAGGEISSDIIDIYPKPVKDFVVELSFSNINRLIGNKIDKKTIKNILLSLDIKITKENEKGLTLNIPPYKVDVQREADVIEEILRIYGYNNIEISEKINSNISYSQKPDKEKLQNIVADMLSGYGFNETMANSLTKSAYYDDLKTYKKDSVVSVLNPLSSDLNGLRQTLLFSGLEAIAYNMNRKNYDLKLYEFGNCYSYKKSASEQTPLNNYFEEQHLAVFISGKKNELSWNTKDEQTTFYQLKAYVENILKRLGFNIDLIDSNEIDNDIFNPGIAYVLNNKKFVDFGAVNKKLLQKHDINSDVFYADFNWNNVIDLIKVYKITYNEIPKYPEVKRDLALLLDQHIHFEQIKKLAYKTEKKLLKKVSLFDIYKGKELEKDKKSYAVSFILQDKNKTLTDEQIDEIMNNFIKAFEKDLGAKIR